MSRPKGKHTQRQPVVADSGEGREIGMSDRMQGGPAPIPGGLNHITNAPAIRREPPTPASRPEIEALNAHGVEPDTHTARERAEFERGPNEPKALRPHHLAPPGPERPAPVPVVIVSEGAGGGLFRDAAPFSLLLSASTGKPIQICGRDRTRHRVLLLNESTSSDILFANHPGDLNNGGGARLPWPGNSYLTLHTQGELWAISADSGTPKISIIQEYDVPFANNRAPKTPQTA